MFLLLSCIAVSLWFVMFRYRRREMYKLASKCAPCDKELPLIGIAHTLMGNTEDIMARLKLFSYVSMKEDGITRAWLSHILYFIVVDPLIAEKVLKTCLQKDDLHRFIRPVLGNGVIFAPRSIWRRRRKILIPAFSPKIVETFVDVFAKQSEILTNKLTERVGQGKFSVMPFVSTYTLDTISQTAMGEQLNAQSNPDTPFLVSLNVMLNLICERIFHLWLQPDWLYGLLPQFSVHQACIKQLHGFTDEVIRKKREELRNESANKTEADSAYDLGNYKKKTFLDHLIHFSGNEDGYTDLELREEILSLTIAATDTSAVALGYALMMLAKYPEVQKLAYEEIYDIFGDSDRILVKEDLLQLKYLERVVKETVRLFPSGPFVIRKIEETITLPSGQELPAGSGVVISIWGIHRDPKYWGPDSEKFDPDRFLPERFNLKHPCSYIPFSHGPRNCIGYQYGLMSIKTALSAILRKFIIVPDPEKSDIPFTRDKIDIMMRDVDGFQIGLQLREPQTNNTL